MCIALISTAHPDYSLLVLSNRDEHLSRPTALANFWDPPHEHVLGGRDLLRSVQGTWLGVTRDGRMAVLTNFHEENSQAAAGLLSRGAMVNAYLQPSAVDVLAPGTFAQQLISGEGARGAGGFSLVCGQIGGNLAVVSNRMKDMNDMKWISRSGETVALSNAAYGDRSWPKVTQGEEGLAQLVSTAVHEKWGLQQLTDRCFSLLSIDSMPHPGPTDSVKDHVHNLRKTIFIPAIGRGAHAHLTEVGRRSSKDELTRVVSEPEEDVYATQKQTVILVTRTGTLTYIEKTLYDGVKRREEPLVRRFEFQIPSLEQ